MDKILICILAGLGAGLGTGLAGMSAAAVITPMLIVFLKVDAYQAVGIALSSDVLASFISASTYAKNKNIDIKNGLIMMLSVLIFTLIGSYIGSYIPSNTLGGFSMFITIALGLKFIIKPVMHAKETNENRSKKKAIIQSIICGSIVGLICGIFGAGGGMMMLLVLVSILGYELKTAVGTSVFIMTFTALLGAISHFIIDNQMPDLTILCTCIISTLVFSLLASIFANKAPTRLINRVLGIVLLILGISMTIINLI